jgi:hypothetical protein
MAYFEAVFPRHGTLAISYQPFKGAQEIGQAAGNEIELSLSDHLKVKIHSDTAFLPASVAGKVYGLYLPEVKSSGPRSTHTFTSSNEDVFLKKLEKLTPVP